MTAYTHKVMFFILKVVVAVAANSRKPNPESPEACRSTCTCMMPESQSPLQIPCLLFSIIKILINVIHCSCTIVPSRCRLVSSLSIKSLVGMSGLRADARPDIPTNN